MLLRRSGKTCPFMPFLFSCRIRLMFSWHLSLVTTTTARAEGVRRTASNRFTVPMTFVEKVSTGFWYERQTIGWAAKWKTISG